MLRLLSHVCYYADEYIPLITTHTLDVVWYPCTPIGLAFEARGRDGGLTGLWCDLTNKNWISFHIAAGALRAFRSSISTKGITNFYHNTGGLHGGENWAGLSLVFERQKKRRTCGCCLICIENRWSIECWLTLTLTLIPNETLWASGRSVRLYRSIYPTGMAYGIFWAPDLKHKRTFENTKNPDLENYNNLLMLVAPTQIQNDLLAVTFSRSLAGYQPVVDKVFARPVHHILQLSCRCGPCSDKVFLRSPTGTSSVPVSILGISPLAWSLTVW